MITRTEFTTIASCINYLFIDMLSMNHISLNFIYTVLIPQLIKYFEIIFNRHSNSSQWLIEQCIEIIKNHPCKNKNIIMEYLIYLNVRSN